MKVSKSDTKSYSEYFTYRELTFFTLYKNLQKLTGVFLDFQIIRKRRLTNTMINLDNFGIANGILQNDPVILDNKDGSKKVLLTVLASDMTRNDQGNRTFQKIPLQGFIPKTYKGVGPYGYLRKGEEVHVEYCIKANEFNHTTHLVLQIDSIKFGKDIKAKEEAADTTKEVEKPQSKNTVPDTEPEIENTFDVNEDLDFDM